MGLELMPIKPGSATAPMPGYDVQILRLTALCATPTKRARSASPPPPPGTLPTPGATTSATWRRIFRRMTVTTDRRRRLPDFDGNCS